MRKTGCSYVMRGYILKEPLTTDVITTNSNGLCGQHCWVWLLWYKHTGAGGAVQKKQQIYNNTDFEWADTVVAVNPCEPQKRIETVICSKPMWTPRKDRNSLLYCSIVFCGIARPCLSPPILWNLGGIPPSWASQRGWTVELCHFLPIKLTYLT